MMKVLFLTTSLGEKLISEEVSLYVKLSGRELSSFHDSVFIIYKQQYDYNSCNSYYYFESGKVLICYIHHAHSHVCLIAHVMC